MPHRYAHVGIDALSHPQIKKLLEGGRVKVKLGRTHKIHMTHEHHKKLQKAHLKGAGMMLQLDPYAQDLARQALGHLKSAVGHVKHLGHSALKHLKGEGFLDDLRSVGSAAGSAFSLGNQIPFNPFDVGYNLGHDVIGPAIMRSQGKGLRAKKHGGNLWGDIRGGVEKVVRSPELKEALTIAKPLAEEAWKNRKAIAEIASAMSGSSGAGFRKKAAPKKRAPPRKKSTHKGGALFPAGMGLMGSYDDEC